MRRSIGLAAGLALCAVSATASAEDPGDAGRGHAYAVKACAECHGIENDEAGSPNFAAPTFETIANTQGMSARALAVWLQTSHPTMPDLIIPVDDMHDVIAYILTLKDKE